MILMLVANTGDTSVILVEDLDIIIIVIESMAGTALQALISMEINKDGIYSSKWDTEWPSNAGDDDDDVQDHF